MAQGSACPHGGEKRLRAGLGTDGLRFPPGSGHLPLVTLCIVACRHPPDSNAGRLRGWAGGPPPILKVTHPTASGLWASEREAVLVNQARAALTASAARTHIFPPQDSATRGQRPQFSSISRPAPRRPLDVPWELAITTTAPGGASRPCSAGSCLWA